jgi:hypothetical protein
MTLTWVRSLGTALHPRSLRAWLIAGRMRFCLYRAEQLMARADAWQRRASAAKEHLQRCA